MMKKFLSLLLALCLACGLCSFASAEGLRTFVDSTGREVTLPANITRIAISGPLAQIFRLCPRARNAGGRCQRLG